MATDAGGTGRKGWSVAAALAAGMLSVLTVVLALAAPEHSIPPEATNLSQAPDFRSGFADIAVSPDGDRVVVVWSEAYSQAVPHRMGSVRLSWASESAGSGWRAPVTVFTGTGRACATQAAVAVTGAVTYVAHVAYVVQRPCGDAGWEETAVHYRTYEMGSGFGLSRTITSTARAGSGDLGLAQVDLTLDGQGDPHFVYLYDYITGTTPIGIIYYRALSAGVLGNQERVSWDEHYSRDPVVAWSNGNIHVVWEDENLAEAEYEIMYNRRSGGGVWSHPSTPPSRYKGRDEFHPRNPDIAAYGDHVVVTWDWQWSEAADRYVVAYTRYATDTDRWIPIYEVGTSGGSVKPLADEDLRDTPYYSYTSTADPLYHSVYVHYLRPSVVLDREGMPTVVWHVDQGGRYDIMYSRAQSVTTLITVGHSIFSWSEPAVFNRSTQGNSASPVAALAPVISPTLHVAYLQRVSEDWETYYKGELEKHNSGGYSNVVFLPLVLRNSTGGPG